MTPEMAFECLLISDDPTVLSTMDPILHDFSICTSVCPQAQRTGDWLDKRATDLIVVDLEAIHSRDLLRGIQEFRVWQRPTVLAVSAVEHSLPGVHIILRKPVTHESGMRSLKLAYSKMLQDFRKHTRFALMESVLVTDEKNRTFPVTVTNIGAGGVGLKTNQEVQVGNVLSFRVRLRGLENEISIRACVRWARPHGIAGCEFVHVPPPDLQLLHAWLESRYRIKQPLTVID
jgi:hypothetical protein